MAQEFENTSLGAKGFSTPKGSGDPAGKAQEQDRLLEVLRAARVMSFEWDVASDVVVRSANASELVGFEASQDTGDNFFKGIYPEDREKVSSAIRCLRPEKPEFAVSYRYVRPADGRELVLEDAGRGEFDSSGRLLRVRGLARDVTEQKRAEEALREQQRLHKSVTDNAALALFIMNDRQHCVFMNPAAVQLTGYTLEETQGRPLHDVVHHTRPDGRPFPLSECAIDRAFPENDREQGEEIFVHKDGHFYPVAFTASPLRTASGQSVGTIIEVQDITERKRAEAALRQSEEKYRQLFESMTEGFLLVEMILDEAGRPVSYRYLDANPALERLTHLKCEEIIGKDAREVLGVVEEHWVAAFGRVALTGEPVHIQEYSEALKNWYDVYGYCPERGKAALIYTNVTERRKTEQALREREAMLARAQQVANLGSWQWDVASDKLVWSEQIYRIFGLSAEQFRPSYETFLSVVSPEDRARVRKAVEAALAGEAYALEFRVTRPDGVQRDVLAQGEVDFDRSGKPVRMIGTALDVTERKQAEEALRLTQASIDRAAEMVAWFRPDGSVYYANEATCRMLGYSREELLKMNALDFSPGFTREQYEEHWREVRERKSFTLQPTHRRKDGSTYSAEVLVNHVMYGGREFIFAYGRDITERKRAEEALRESEENYRTLFTSIDEGFCVIEMLFDEQGKPNDWRFVEVNPAFERHNGLVQAIGKRIRELTPGVEAKWFEIYGKVALTGQAIRFEESSEAFNRWFDLYTFRVGQPDEHKVAVLFTDITGRKQAEAALAQHREELERLVAERTAKLQELVGELEHFSYTITHDLKSPLRAMRGFAEIAGQVCRESEAKPFLDRIATAAERMDGLIADALSYSRSVRQQLPLGDVDAGAFLRGILDSYPQFQPWKAQIRVEGPLPVVLANEAGLTQVFSNLLANAVKFVKPGEKPEIRVWSSDVMGHGRDPEWVRIWVEDKGIGIAKEMLPRVFEMFSRGSKDYEGTGIGLALVRKVVQRMGGKVGVESEEGKGSRFWIELGRGEARVALSQGTGQQPASAGEGMVLYVEDEESDAEFMNRAFTENGLGEKLRRVGTGRAAIEYLSGANEFADREKYPVPSVVLLDLNLPQVSGFGVLEWIRNHPDYARLPVVVFSSSTREDDRVRARELGANEFVAKPSSGLKFGEIVEGLQGKWLGRRVGG
jgi:PAS domain S-box-containing protein